MWYAICIDMLDHPLVKTITAFLLMIGVTIFLLGVSGEYDQGSGQEGLMQRFFKF